MSGAVTDEKVRYARVSILTGKLLTPAGSGTADLVRETVVAVDGLVAPLLAADALAAEAGEVRRVGALHRRGGRQSWREKRVGKHQCVLKSMIKYIERDKLKALHK